MAPCDLLGVDNNICHNVPDDFNDKINAFGPDEGIGCLLYESVEFFHWYHCRGTTNLTSSGRRNSDCGGNSIFLAYPGDSHLTGVNFGNITSSVRCIPFR